MVERKILLNPGPATTSDTVKYAQLVPDICPREEDFGKVMEGIRKDLTKIAGEGEEYTSILFAGSGTAAMEATISSVVAPEKKILIINNGAYGERLAKIAKTHTLNLIEKKFRWGKKIEIDDIKTALNEDNDIAYLAMVHHETSTGILNPIKKIGKIAKKNDCTFIVDTISSFAGIPFSIKDCHIDFMMSTSNKCIQGIAGVSFVICKKSVLEKIKDYPRKSFYLDLYSQYDFLESKKQTRFTPPVQVIYALRQAIDEFFEEGAKNRYNRYRQSYNTLVKGLLDRGFEIFLEDDVEHSNILTTVIEPDHHNFSFQAFHDKLFDRGFTIYPGKLKNENTFRVAVMGAIDYTDIEIFLDAVDEVLNEMNVNLPIT